MDELLYFFSKTQPRRPTVVRQVLSNKRTVSNLFWGMRYGIIDWLAVCPRLERAKFDGEIKELIRRGRLIETGDREVLLTETGVKQCAAFESQHYRIKKPAIFGALKTQLWQELLRLLVQVISEASYHNRRYFVVASSFQAQTIIKRWYKENRQYDLGRVLGEQLLLFLENVDRQHADIFMQLFSGHDVIAKTIEQVAADTNYSACDVQFLWEDLSASLAAFLYNGSSIFKSLVAPLMVSSRLSKSAAATYGLYESGLPLSTIKTKRRLKESTVIEHLLEAAIFVPTFDFKRLLSVKDYYVLRQLFQGNIDNWSYKKLESVEPTVSFAKFRLYQIEQTRLNADNISD